MTKYDGLTGAPVLVVYLDAISCRETAHSWCLLSLLPLTFLRTETVALWSLARDEPCRSADKRWHRTAIPALRVAYLSLKTGFIFASSGTVAAISTLRKAYHFLKVGLFVLLAKLSEQCLGALQIDCIEALAEPLVDRQK